MARRSKLYIVIQDDHMYFHEAYAPLLADFYDTLDVHCVPQSEPWGAFAKGPETLFFIADELEMDKHCTKQLQSLADGVYNKGCGAVLGGPFSSSNENSTISDVFKALSLPWGVGNLQNMDWYLNQFCGTHFPVRRLHGGCSAEAVYLTGVKLEHAVYGMGGTTDGSIPCAMAACIPAGKGRIGYIGDVDAADETMHATYAMLCFH